MTDVRSNLLAVTVFNLFDPDLLDFVDQDLEALKKSVSKLELGKYHIQELQVSVTGSEVFLMYDYPVLLSEKVKCCNSWLH